MQSPGLFYTQMELRMNVTQYEHQSGTEKSSTLIN